MTGKCDIHLVIYLNIVTTELYQILYIMDVNCDVGECWSLMNNNLLLLSHF